MYLSFVIPIEVQLEFYNQILSIAHLQGYNTEVTVTLPWHLLIPKTFTQAQNLDNNYI